MSAAMASWREMWRRSSSHNLLRRAYAAWAPRYDVGPGNPVQRANDLALAVCVPKAPVRGVALDVACGTGRHAVLLQARGWERRFAFDLSPEMLDRAENYQGRAVADLRHVPCRPVELVMCSLAVGHLRNLEASLDELCNLVRRNGDLVISDIHPRAVASGLKRAFSGEDGRAWRLPHTVHRIEQVVEALEKRGLSTLLISEPAPEPPLRGEPKHPNVPLVYALRARRLGD